MSSRATAHRLVASPSSGALFDVAIATAAMAVSLAQLSHGGIDGFGTGPDVHDRSLDLLGVVITGCSTLPLVAWRRFPFGVFSLTAAAAVLLGLLGYPLDVGLGPAAALYLLAASSGPHTAWTQRTTATVVGLFVAYLGAAAFARDTFPGVDLLHTGLAWSVAWFAGERTRLQREHIADLSQRALRAECEAERERLLAAAEERTRIARDLHDSAGHAISVIAVRAGAARLRHHQDPARSFSALEAIEELARQTADDIDHIVGTLREDRSGNGGVEPPLGLASIDTLVARHAAAGFAITVGVSGPRRSLGGGADEAAYRIVQEALTNAARHGAGSARIDLAFDDVGVEFSVTNPMLGNGAPRSGGGYGLTGMRERAGLLGGSLDAERVDGTFRVRARLPDRGHRA